MRRASYPTPVFGASPNGPNFIGRGFNPKVRTRVKRVSPIFSWAHSANEETPGLHPGEVGLIPTGSTTLR
jgi:hypothetical protein